MGLILKGIEIENFKSYKERQLIKFSDLSVLLGANSSGKSTALQALLVIKQTMECNSPDEELLLSGKYVTLGDYDDIICDPDKDFFSFAVLLEQNEKSEYILDEDDYRIEWIFKKSADKISAKVSQINVRFQNIVLTLKRDEDDFYVMYIEQKRIPLSAKIFNLMLGQYRLSYDETLNSKTLDFLNKLTHIMISKKTPTSPTDQLVSTEVLGEFYFRIVNNIQKKNPEEKENLDVRKQLAEKIEDLLDRASRAQFPKYEIISPIFPKEVRINILLLALLGNEPIDDILKIVEDYEKYLINYETSEHCIDKYNGKADLGEYPFLMFRNEEEKKDNLSQLKYAIDFYEDFYTDIVSKIFFIGPIREAPKGLYNIGFETVPKYVGPTGSFFASVLLHENKKRKKYILPHDEVEECSLSEALSEWMLHLNIASDVKVNKKNSFGFSVSVENMQQVESDIMNVGIGTSQVLPVLISILLSEPQEIMIFEQPELHLHPYAQSRLADMFAAYCSHGRKIIIETHSEYFLLRLRYQIVKRLYSKENAAINFFKNDEGTKVKCENISGMGNINYPSDFRDETQELLDDILKAAIERKGLQ